MPTVNVGTSPTQLDDGTAYLLRIVNTSRIADIYLSRTATRVRPQQSHDVYPEGVAVTAYTSAGTVAVTTEAFDEPVGDQGTIFDNGSSGAAKTVQFRNGERQTVAINGASGTIVALTIGPSDIPAAEMILDIVQDVVGGKFVYITNAEGPGGCHVKVDTAANARTIVRISTSNSGATNDLSSDSLYPLPGVDPIDIPGCLHHLSAVHDPLALGALTAITDRKGTIAPSSFGGSPTLTEDAGALSLTSGFWPRKRRRYTFPANTANMAYVTLPSPVGTTVPFMLTVAGRFGDTTADVSLVHLKDSAQSGAGSGHGVAFIAGNPYVTSPGPVFVNYVGTGITVAVMNAAPHVVTSMWPVTPNVGQVRFDGTQWTGADSVWGAPTRSFNQLGINLALAGHNVAAQPIVAELALFNQYHATLHPKLVTMWERWIGYSAGVTSTVLGI